MLQVVCVYEPSRDYLPRVDASWRSHRGSGNIERSEAAAFSSQEAANSMIRILVGSHDYSRRVNTQGACIASTRRVKCRDGAILGSDEALRRKIGVEIVACDDSRR